MFGKSAAESVLLLLAFDTGDTQVSHFLLLFVLNQHLLALHPATFHCHWTEAESHHLHLRAHQLVSVLIKESYLSLRAHQSSLALCEAAAIHPSPASLLRGCLCRDGGQEVAVPALPAARRDCSLLLCSRQDLNISSFLPPLLQGARATWDELFSCIALAHTCSGRALHNLGVVRCRLASNRLCSSSASAAGNAPRRSPLSKQSSSVTSLLVCR